MGVAPPYSSSGIVTNKGVETAINLFDNTGSLTWHLGGSLSYAKNKIIDMIEEYRPNDYLKRTGQSINQAFGLEATGFSEMLQRLAVIRSFIHLQLYNPEILNTRIRTAITSSINLTRFR